MTYLTLLLLIKILSTLVGVAIPFLLLSPERLDRVLQVTQGSALVYRLYAVAIIALLVVYFSGLCDAQQGEFPWNVVYVGVVSNGGAALTLLRYAKTKDALTPKRSMRHLVLGGYFALITACLLFSALFPSLALSTI